MSDPNPAEGRPSAVWLWGALIVYGLWLACLTVMAVFQEGAGPR